MALSALRAALALNWASGEATPMGYRLFSPLIWLAESPEPDETEATSEGDPEADPASVGPDPALADDALALALDHPAFYGWLRDVSPEGLTAADSASYSRRFRAMSRWLAIAGDHATARQAATFAHYLDTSAPRVASILTAARRKRQDSQD
jgi:hypothetical protein